jgi:hypothetical protein
MVIIKLPHWWYPQPFFSVTLPEYGVLFLLKQVFSDPFKITNPSKY